jgi:HEAT repeat protein
MSRQNRYWIVLGLVAAAIFSVSIARFTAIVVTGCYLRLASGHGAAGLIPFARARLTSDNALVRSEAARALGSIGPKAVSAAPDLLLALSDDLPQVASSAAWALGNIQPPEQEIVSALINALGHEDGEVRRYAAFAISLYGARARSAIPRLTRSLKDEHIASLAARALGEMGSAARDAIPDMTALLASSNRGARAEAVLALSKLPPLPDETVSAMTRLLKDDEELVRNAAQRALSEDNRRITAGAAIRQ